MDLFTPIASFMLFVTVFNPEKDISFEEFFDYSPVTHENFCQNLAEQQQDALAMAPYYLSVEEVKVECREVSTEVANKYQLLRFQMLMDFQEKQDYSDDVDADIRMSDFAEHYGAVAAYAFIKTYVVEAGFEPIFDTQNEGR